LKAMPWLSRIVAALPFRGDRKRKGFPETQAVLDRGEQASKPAANEPSAPVPQGAADLACPTCGAAMFKRFSRQTNQMFWGCTHYPRCKGTRSA